MALACRGRHVFWQVVTSPEALAALKLTLAASAIVAAIQAVTGTVIAWVLVRDEFPGKKFVNAVIDLPFALPTIVAGLVLLTLYGPKGQLGVHIAYTRAAIVLALLFVTLPFVVRAVQPVLLELDREMEEAAASLGSGAFSIFRRIVLPNILPAILSGVALAFARAIGEIGSLVLISGNQPVQDRGRLGLHLRAHPVGRRDGGGRGLGRAARDLAASSLLGIGAFRRWRTRHDR